MARRHVGRYALLTALVLAGCQQQEAANCPDKYEGQSITIAGKITKTASFLGLATLTTVQDAKGGVCLITSKTSVGNEGDNIRLTNMVAVHDEKTIIPNFLRAAAEDATSAATAAATSQPARTLSPTPTPEPALIRKSGGSVTYTDGWKVTVQKWEPQAATRFNSPKPGMQFIAVVVRYDNGTGKEASYNSFSWKMQDSNGVRRNSSYADRNDALNSGKLAPGGFVVGSIVFEVPVGDPKVAVIYEDFSYQQATWELF